VASDNNREIKMSRNQAVKRSRVEGMKRFSLFTFLPLSLLTFFMLFSGCSERLSEPVSETSSGQVSAEQVKKAEETAHMVATLLTSGRIVVELYQDLINDPDKGYKHFTPEIFVKKVTDHFGKKTNVKLQLQACPMEDQDEAMDFLMLLLDSSKKVLADVQVLINKEGEGYKGFIGAVFGRSTSLNFFKKSGIEIKQTTLRYRNPGNAPDKFETKALKMFLNPSHPEGEGYGKVVNKDGKPYYRYMLPIYVEKACLKCHGESDGKADPTGHMKEGYSVGEARWASSVSIPL
jgi:general secretion pathway protein A